MLDTILFALAESNRRQILRIIGRGELSAGEIASHFTITRAAVSQHLGVLVEAGLLKVRRDRTRRLYRVRREGLSELQAFLSSFWDDYLSILQIAAESEEKSQAADEHE